MLKDLNLEDIFTKALFLLTAAACVAVFFACLAMRNFKFLLPLLIIIFSCALGLFVYIKGRQKRVNTSFCLFSFFVSLWTFAIFMYSQAGSTSEALFWSRMAAASSSMIPALFLYFTYVFPKEQRIPQSSSILTWLFFAVFFTAISFTDIIVKGIVVTPLGFMFSPGIGLTFFLLYFAGFMGYAFFTLLRTHYESSGIVRMQVRYVILGFFLGIAPPIATNIVLPLLGISEFSGYGPLFSIITMAFIAYSIVKHRLMSIELVIQRGIIYGVITALILSMYVLIILLSEKTFREAVGYSSFIATALSAVVIAIFYQPFFKFLQETTNRVFFRGHYDYQKTLMDVSSAIASIIRLDELTKLITSTFTETMKVSELSFLLYEKGRGRFKSSPVEIKGSGRYRKMEIDERSPIIDHLRRTREILMGDELEGRLSRTKSAAEAKRLRELKDEIDRVAVPLWVPILLKDDLVGVIASGNKLSGEIFTSEDLGLLSTLANQTAVALDNTRLYEEIVSMKTYSEDILKSMTNGVLTTDLKGKVITFNAMAEKITGLSSSEAVGYLAGEIWKGGVVDSVIGGALRGERYLNYEAGLIRKDASVIPVSVSADLLKDSAGKSIGVLVVMADQSEVKELENKVRQADKLAALGTMAAGMAHEIKNPLSSMKVLSQLMELKFEDPEFRKKFIEIMPREIGRVDRIVESLLGFARAAAPKFSAVELPKLIDETLKFFEDNAASVNVKIERDYSLACDILVDPGQMSQVFSNLILNAIQAMPDGGVLRIVAAEGKKKEGILENVLVEISDTGQGIPKESLKKLFDPFFTTKHGGTGLGLTIAHSIVDGHKGTIDVKSEKGKGTTFSVTLPVTQ